PFLPRSQDPVETPAAWDLANFTRACSSAAGDRHLDARGRALANRLLVEADQQDFPLELLSARTEAAAKIDWRQRYATAPPEILSQVEQEWTEPGGVRRWIQGGIVFLADWVPPLVLLAALVMLLWRYFDPFQRGYQVQLSDVLLPLAILLAVLVSL